jgi:hypothetical protein
MADRRQSSGSIKRSVLIASVACIGVAALAVAGLAEFTSPGSVLPRHADDDVLVVHEWGTFTAVQNVDGTGMPGVNTDDEPVPDFVHDLGQRLLDPTYRTGKALARTDLPPARIPLVFLISKGLPPAYSRLITMRLETPVIYFHPPASQTRPIELDVNVAFRGGWLSEFYPRADATSPGLENYQLNSQTVGTLSWKNLQVGTADKGPQTDEPVWLEPRDVQAATVTTPDGESERYLFYRGVGNFEAPLRVVTDELTNTLSIHGRFDSLAGKVSSVRIPQLWLVEVRQDGSLAYRTLDGVSAHPGSDELLTKVSGTFTADDFCSSNFDALRTEMHAALVDDGLYGDEADAMLDTWRHAYFKSPGLRLFFLVPQVWTDHQMPLTISQPAKVDRVMMARIEIVSKRQRELVRRIADADPESIDTAWVDTIPAGDSRARFLAGRAEFGDLGVEIPADYQAYLDLGRFRNAILHDAHRREPTEGLKEFINIYGMNYPVGQVVPGWPEESDAAPLPAEEAQANEAASETEVPAESQ